VFTPPPPAHWYRSVCLIQLAEIVMVILCEPACSRTHVYDMVGRVALVNQYLVNNLIWHKGRRNEFVLGGFGK